MKTSKNVIKLNESLLKQIISESVKNILNENEKTSYEWFDEIENEYLIYAMVKSDMNPLKKVFRAKNIDDAISQAKEYFSRFSEYGEKDIDIFYVKHDGYNNM